jgi:hypothetical protein
MVVFVAAIFPTHWVVSDGWYAIFAVPDATLQRYVAQSRSTHMTTSNKLVGTKIVIWNASLHNCQEGMDPLDSPVHEAMDRPFDPNIHAHVSLFVNSTRRVHWRTKLGLEHPRT